MANTLGTSITEILANEGLAAFKAGLAPVRAFSLNLEDDSRLPHEIVTTQLVTGMSAGSFSGSYETGDNTTTAVPVTLSQSKFKSFHVTDVEASNTNFDLQRAFSREASYAVAKSVQTVAWAAMTHANYDTEVVVGAASAFDADALLGALGGLDDNGAPQENRVVILSRTYATAILKDIKDNVNAGSTPLREGAIGRLGGADVFMTTVAFPAHGVGIVAHPSGMAAAIRPVRPQEGASQAGLQYAEPFDPESGVRLGFRTWYSTATGKRWGSYHSLFGVAVGQPTGLIRLVSQADHA